MGMRSWMTTFIDMLMLLLTFLVFILAISKFKLSEGDALNLPVQKIEPGPAIRPGFVKGTAIELIKGLKTPRMSPSAQRILSEMSQTSQVGTYEGVNLHYNESKISILLPESLTFLPGSSTLDTKALDILTSLVKPLKTSPFLISIEGHTDSETGEGGDNMRLSIDRALSVAEALLKAGIPVGRLSVGGYGPHRPIADNSDLVQKKLNRRVEIHIMINEEFN